MEVLHDPFRLCGVFKAHKSGSVGLAIVRQNLATHHLPIRTEHRSDQLLVGMERQAPYEQVVRAKRGAVAAGSSSQACSLVGCGEGHGGCGQRRSLREGHRRRWRLAGALPSAFPVGGIAHQDRRIEADGDVLVQIFHDPRRLRDVAHAHERRPVGLAAIWQHLAAHHSAVRAEDGANHVVVAMQGQSSDEQILRRRRGLRRCSTAGQRVAGNSNQRRRVERKRDRGYATQRLPSSLSGTPAAGVAHSQGRRQPNGNVLVEVFDDPLGLCRVTEAHEGCAVALSVVWQHPAIDHVAVSAEH
mmetsp:Transcript_44933/g.124517  ORF Transcript_44933/g.124517 Transcript_44933/m.124517 type:complete len:301 (-) Transcript_44933:209-1111(-)